MLMACGWGCEEMGGAVAVVVGWGEERKKMKVGRREE